MGRRTESNRPVADVQLAAAADRLSRAYAGDGGPFTEDEVVSVVHESAEELRDAPVQTFVPLLAENKARDRLHGQLNARRRC
jgi:phospholipase C